jgi:hypothetical protein
LNAGQLSTFSLVAWESDDIPSGWFKLGSWVVDTEIINIEQLTLKALASLDDEETTLRAELHDKLTKIEETRQSILALPHIIEKD